ncbi:bifunctional nuclease family protein [Wenyingzhuangia sp. 2_MG-2023]|uniref:bifunctional nuclease family protein n=1 Tax=Wenyingzhuangia sp. 2_MG-2023 TaxID=3062639 RepID=UPI0026E432D2|nr:bifunctional nuclease family protein [Wenyingzhuangia sp. 2_MG-2023]MDO6737923.1 bifunctional nuclease family protein [Wenyingzhuangia sp. 2_MG-2023]
MSLVQLDIRGISYSQTQTGAYALVLNEIDGDRTLPIVIGAFEAQSIAIALESEIIPPRPLTHDLFKTFAESYSVNIKQVIIHKLIDGVFYSSMVCEKEGEEKVFDARTSDAIALAIRFNAPIYTYQNILEKAGIILKQEDFIDDLEDDDDIEEKESELSELFESSNSSENVTNKYQKYSTVELEQKLTSAIEKEDYETAAHIRDELNKR